MLHLFSDFTDLLSKYSCITNVIRVVGGNRYKESVVSTLYYLGVFTQMKTTQRREEKGI